MALMLAVGLVVGLGWFAARSLGGGTGPDTTPLAAEGPETSSSEPTSSSPPLSISSTPPPPSDPAAAGLPPAIPSTTPPAPPPPPPPPAPPGPCADDAIGVVAETGASEYRVGQKPLLRLVITNISPVACIRDVDAGLQELLVFGADGVTRLWSSNDCAAGGRPDLRTLQPGEQVRSELSWAGRTSAVGCPTARQTVPPGDYNVVARLGPVASGPAPLRLVP